MTIENIQPWLEATGNGLTSSYTFRWPALSEGDVVGYIDGVLQRNVFVSLNTDQNNDAGGMFTFLSGPPVAGSAVWVGRVTELTQSASFPKGGRFPAESVESALDKLTMALQEQQNTGLGRALRVPNGEASVPPIPAKNQRAGMLLGFDSEGNPIVVEADTGDKYVKKSGDTMIQPLAGPPSITPDDYMPQFQVAEVVDNRIESIPGFDPQQLIDYGLVTSAVGDELDYGSIA